MAEYKYNPSFDQSGEFHDLEIHNNGYIFRGSKYVISRFSCLIDESLEDKNCKTFIIPDRFSLQSVDYILCESPFQAWECDRISNNTRLMSNLAFEVLELIEYLGVIYNRECLLEELFGCIVEHIKKERQIVIQFDKMEKLIDIYQDSKSPTVEVFFVDIIKHARKSCNVKLLSLVPSSRLANYLLFHPDITNKRPRKSPFSR